MDISTSDRFEVTIDGRTAHVARGTTVLEAARQIGVSIPTLCHYRGLSPYGACRVCLVEIDTPRGPRQVASCSHPVEDGLVVRTQTEAVLESRKTVVELLLAQAPHSRELAEFANELGVQSTRFEPAIEGKCILCGLCVRTCNELMSRGAISFLGRAPEGNLCGVRRTERSMPGVRGVHLRLPDRRDRFHHRRHATGQAPSYRLQPAFGGSALDRLGAPAGLAADSGD